MLSDQEISSVFQDKIRKIKPASFAPLSQFIDLNEAPNFKAGGDTNKVPFVEIAPFGEELLRSFDDYSYGVPNGGMPVVGLATRIDPTRAPAGKHTLYLYHYEPYHLRDGGAAAWDKVKEKLPMMFWRHSVSVALIWTPAILLAGGYSVRWIMNG